MAHGDITHIDIPVSDTGRAQGFYQALFGWQIAEVPGYEGYPMWQAPNKISGGGLAPRLGHGLVDYRQRLARCPFLWHYLSGCYSIGLY